MNDQTTQLAILENVQASILSLATQVMPFVEIATDFRIVDAEGAAVAGEQLQAIAKLRKRANEERLDHTRPLDELKSRIISEYNEPGDKLAQAEKGLRDELTRWTKEQARIAAEAAAAEAARIAEETAAAERAAQKERDRLASLKDPKAIARAQDRLADAEAAVEAAQVSTPMAVAPAKVKGFSLVSNWKAKIEVDAVMQLCKAIAAGRTDLVDYLVIDQVFANKMAKALKSKMAIPGISAVNDQTSAVR